MPKMICTDCQTEFKPEENGIYVIEMFNNPPRPYKIWSADLWKCRECDKEIVAGFGNGPLFEHFEDGFQDFLDKIRNSKNVIYDYERPQEIE